MGEYIIRQWVLMSKKGIYYGHAELKIEAWDLIPACFRPDEDVAPTTADMVPILRRRGWRVIPAALAWEWPVKEDS